jgi:hypothetical protein
VKRDLIITLSALGVGTALTVVGIVGGAGKTTVLPATSAQVCASWQADMRQARHDFAWSNPILDLDDFKAKAAERERVLAAKPLGCNIPD